MNSHSIMYWIAKNRYNFKSILIFAFIKAIIPLFSYDGEPSVPNGIVFQLPSSHLFIHWVPTKLSIRVMPYGGNSCQLQLLFLFDSYRPAQSHGNLLIQWTRSSMLPSVGLVADAVPFATPSLPGCFPEPCPDPVTPNPGKALELCYCLAIMLPVPSSVPVFLCLTKVSSDHRSLPLSVSHILPAAVCRLSLSVTASFLADYPALLCNRYAVP